MEFTSFYHPSSLSVWDLGDLMAAERDSFELLGSSQQHHQLQDIAAVSPHSFLLETLQPQPQPQTKLPSADSTIYQAPPSNAKSVTSRVESLCSDHLLINSPATPNSSSISSASSEAVNEDKAKREEQEEEEGHKKSDTNKQ